MLGEPKRRSPRDKLQKHLKACQKPLKSYLLKAITLLFIVTGIFFSFFSSAPLSLRDIGFIALALLALLAFIFSIYHTDRYRDLQLSIIQYQYDKIDFFKTYGDQHEEVINDIRLIYETDHTVTVQFAYQGKTFQLALPKGDIPQPYANQELVVIARFRTIAKDDLAEYLSLFDIRDLTQEYQSILERPIVTSGFFSKDDILRLSEAPDKPLVSFQLALITKPKESEVSQ